jgi:hypothetical protein
MSRLGIRAPGWDNLASEVAELISSTVDNSVIGRRGYQAVSLTDQVLQAFPLALVKTSRDPDHLSE